MASLQYTKDMQAAQAQANPTQRALSEQERTLELVREREGLEKKRLQERSSREAAAKAAAMQQSAMMAARREGN